MVDSAFSMLRRVVRVIAVLFEAHLVLAKGEAQRDLTRIVVALLAISFAGLCFSSVWLLLQALAVMGLMGAGLGAVPAIASVAGGNLIVGFVAAMAGRTGLNQPVLPESRSLLGKTVDALID